MCLFVAKQQKARGPLHHQLHHVNLHLIIYHHLYLGTSTFYYGSFSFRHIYLSVTIRIISAQHCMCLTTDLTVSYTYCLVLFRSVLIYHHVDYFEFAWICFTLQIIYHECIITFMAVVCKTVKCFRFTSLPCFSSRSLPMLAGSTSHRTNHLSHDSCLYAPLVSVLHRMSLMGTGKMVLGLNLSLLSFV